MWWFVELGFHAFLRRALNASSPDQLRCPKYGLFDVYRKIGIFLDIL